MRRLGFAIAGTVVLAGALVASITTVRFGGAVSEPPPQFRPRSLVAVPPVPLPRGPLIPVQGYAAGKLADSWGDARSEGRGHKGIDLMAAEGTPVVAVVPGRIEKLFESRLGGTTLYLRSADERWTYYYAHLAGYASGVREGLPVRAGQVLGYVGDTGDAGSGNHHLHFSVSRMRPGQRWWQGEDVNPYPILAEPNLADRRDGR